MLRFLSLPTDPGEGYKKMQRDIRIECCGYFVLWFCYILFLRKLLTFYTALCEGGVLPQDRRPMSYRIQYKDLRQGITIHGYFYYLIDLFHVQFVCNIACFVRYRCLHSVRNAISIIHQLSMVMLIFMLCKGLSRDVIITIKTIVLYRAFYLFLSYL